MNGSVSDDSLQRLFYGRGWSVFLDGEDINLFNQMTSSFFQGLGEKIQQKTNKCKNDACFPERLGGEGVGLVLLKGQVMT